MKLDETATPVSRAYRYIWVYLGIALSGIAFGAGILAGRSPWLVKSPSATTAPEITAVVNIDRSKSQATTVDFNQFWRVWDEIKHKYVRQPVKETDLFYGALQGLVAGLGDPYSSYFPPKAAEDFAKSLSGEFSGIGAEIGVKQSQLMIIAPLPGSPAERSGLHPGDKILVIDKLPTAGLDVSAAVGKIRGPAGTTTTLTIGRDGWVKAKDFTLTRETINVPAILTADLPGGIAHIRIMQFNERTMPEFSKAIASLKARRPAGLIIDLRNNPGGLLESAVELASEWIKAGPIVREKLYNGAERSHDTAGRHRLNGLPTAVLVNGGSASASEIVAGALQDYKAATIIGEQTFGKGSVQDYEQLPDGSALKVTIAEWLTPLGTNINEKGITPDVAIKEDFEKEAVGEDAMIQKALEVLRPKPSVAEGG